MNKYLDSLDNIIVNASLYGIQFLSLFLYLLLLINPVFLQTNFLFDDVLSLPKVVITNSLFLLQSESDFILFLYSKFSPLLESLELISHAHFLLLKIK